MRQLKIQRMSAYPEIDMRKSKTNFKPIAQKDMTMLNCIERIISLMTGEALSRESLRRAKRYINYVAEKQDITSFQAVLMAMSVNLGDDNCITIRDLSRSLGCQNITILAHLEDIDELERRWIIRKTNAPLMQNGYHLNDGVINALSKNEPFVRPSRKAGDIYILLSFVFKLTHARNNNEISTDDLVSELNTLYDENEDLPFVQELRSLKLENSSMLIISQMCRHLVNSNVREVSIDRLAFLFDKDFEMARQMRLLQNGSHELMRKGLVDFTGNEGLKNRGEFVLTDRARKTLLSEVKFDYFDNNDNKCSEIIKCGSIIEKPLIFDKYMNEQYERFRLMLTEDNYCHIKNRLSECNMRTGLTVLLYGAPGTGKTETVKQIARITGRDIMQVNMSQIRSMWVGQSEKNIKSIFDNYREICSHSPIIPILLFNEADAVIGTRNEVTRNSVGKMENTLQNIILQEMEDFEGIFVATTNMATNFDKAFERRFLYKIEYTKPTENARKVLWHTIMPGLDKMTVDILAGKYLFSGGQIENISRKSMIDTILYENGTLDIDRLIEYCENEKLDKNVTSKIGFI